MYSVRRRMAYGSPALILAIVLLVLPAILQQLSADDRFPTVAVATQATATIGKVKRRRRSRGVRTRNLSRYSPQDVETPVAGVDASTPDVEENNLAVAEAATSVRQVEPRRRRRRRRRLGVRTRNPKLVRTRNLSRYGPQDREMPVAGVDAPAPDADQNVVVAEAATNVRKVRRRRGRRVVRTRNLGRHGPRDLEVPTVGGYSPVPDLEKNAMITEAATFVLGEARSPSCTYSIGLSSSQDAADISTVRVVEASQQVVAGLNIRLMLAFEDARGVCMGGCTVVVYNHFGDLTITKWNEENCKDLSRSGFETGDDEKDSAR